MNRFNLIRNISMLTLAIASVTCFTIGGIKSAKSIQATDAVNSYQDEIAEVRRTHSDYKKKGTEGYIKIQELTEKSNQANKDFEYHTVGLTGTCIAGSLCLFGLIYVGVNTTKSKD